MNSTFPTIIRKGKRVRVTVKRQEPLYAIVVLMPGIEPEIVAVFPRGLARAYRHAFKSYLRVWTIRLVPIRWELAEGQQLSTLGASFGLAKGVQS